MALHRDTPCSLPAGTDHQPGKTWEQQLADLRALDREALLSRAVELLGTDESGVEAADDELSDLVDGWDDHGFDGDLIELALARWQAGQS